MAWLQPKNTLSLYPLDVLSTAGGRAGLWWGLFFSDAIKVALAAEDQLPAGDRRRGTESVIEPVQRWLPPLSGAAPVSACLPFPVQQCEQVLAAPRPFEPHVLD